MRCSYLIRLAFFLWLDVQSSRTRFLKNVCPEVCRRIRTGCGPLPAKSRAAPSSVISMEKVYDNAEVRLARGHGTGIKHIRLQPRRDYRRSSGYRERSQG